MAEQSNLGNIGLKDYVLELFVSTFEAIAVLLGIGILGFWIIVRKIVPEAAFGLLSPLAIDLALPALVFVNIVSRFRPAQLPNWWALPLWWLAFTALAAALTAAFSRLARKSIRREFVASLFYQNAMFFPVAIITGMFGSQSELLVLLFFFALFYPSFFFSTYPFFFRQTGQRIQWARIINPVLAATLLATALCLFGLNNSVPRFVLKALTMVGYMAVPLLMLIVGGTIYTDFKNKGQLFISEIIKFLLVKNILFPLITLCLVVLIRPSYNVALLLILQSAVPPVSSMPVVVERAGGNRGVVNQFVFTSFLFALVTIPAVMWLFSQYFSPPAQ